MTAANMHAQVPKAVVMEVASKGDRRRYDTFALRSYVEDNRRALVTLKRLDGVAGAWHDVAGVCQLFAGPGILRESAAAQES